MPTAPAIAGYYPVTIAGVLFSLGIIMFAFQYALREISQQSLDSFAAENARALAEGDAVAIADRLTSISGGRNWVCLSVSKNGRQFLGRRQGSSDCSSGPFQRQLTFRPKENPTIAVEMTLRLPRSLETAWIIVVAMQALCLLVIILTLNKAGKERLLAEKRRDEDLRREEARRTAMLAELAAQVAHDIRSPLTALDSAMAEVAQLPERKRILIRGAVNQIRDIANSLLETNNTLKTSEKSVPPPGTAGAEPSGIRLLSSLVESVVTEKRQQYRSKIGLEIDARLDAAAYGLFGKIQPAHFKRVLSNLINNAVEALGEKGRVRVDLASAGGELILKVQDDGKGIPPEILAKLGQRGETYGKAGGSGLGLYHARTTTESWGGRLEIQSEVGKGTSITLRLPTALPPAWFVSKLELKSGGAVVVLDDDKGIHQIWKDRFDALEAEKNGIEIHHCSTPDEVRAWARRNPQKAAAAVFLTDYELIGYKESGLDVVEDLAICDRAILITSRFEEKEILDRCLRLKVRMIPKALAGFVPLTIKVQPDGANPLDPATGPAAAETPPKLRRLDAVLIEDDELVRMAWEDAAAEHRKTFLGFQSVADFLREAPAIDRSTPIYLDVKLGDDVRGDQESLRISDLGFSDVYLATGHAPASFAALKHLRGVVGKDPPWLKPVS